MTFPSKRQNFECLCRSCWVLCKLGFQTILTEKKICGEVFSLREETGTSSIKSCFLSSFWFQLKLQKKPPKKVLRFWNVSSSGCNTECVWCFCLSFRRNMMKTQKCTYVCVWEQFVFACLLFTLCFSTFWTRKRNKQCHILCGICACMCVNVILHWGNTAWIVFMEPDDHSGIVTSFSQSKTFSLLLPSANQTSCNERTDSSKLPVKLRIPDETLHSAKRNVWPNPHRTHRRKWDLLMWMRVFTLHASNIKGFACARPVWIGLRCHACMFLRAWVFSSNARTYKSKKSPQRHQAFSIICSDNRVHISRAVGIVWSDHSLLRTSTICHKKNFRHVFIGRKGCAVYPKTQQYNSLTHLPPPLSQWFTAYYHLESFNPRQLLPGIKPSAAIKWKQRPKGANSPWIRTTA